MKTAIALLILFGILMLPEHPKELIPSAFLRLPLELPVVVLIALLLRGHLAVIFRVAVVAAAGTLLLLRLADLGSNLAFNRRFSPLVEMHLIGDGWDLASQAVGKTDAAIGVLVALLLFVLLCILLWRGLAALSHDGQRRGAAKATAATLVVAATAFWFVDQQREKPLTTVQASFIPDLMDRLDYMHRSILDQRAFVTELASDPLAYSAPTFSALEGHDVLLIFVESYGRSFVDGERFKGPARERLHTVDRQLQGAGLHARSGWLTSPVRGGRSWLAHASVASGLMIENQARFDRLIPSTRTSLNRLFGQAGWHTVGIMPAIRFDWPEGGWYGFDTLLDASAMGYAGEKFGYVTMPDQYTLSAFETRVRAESGKPVMAEIALISSHAPWTPLPRTVAWDDVGDGRIFDGSHRFGGPTAEVWKEREQVREHYAMSLDYTLDVIGGYLERHGQGALVIVLGDHQPTSIIDGWDETADVPVHVISAESALLDRLPASHWSVGMLPLDGLPSQPMSSFRETLSRRFESRPVAVTQPENDS